jgi:ferredoxin-type protein NapG
VDRRSLLGSFTALAACAVGAAVALPPARGQGQRSLRPPGALAEDNFLATCIRCGQCGEICPNNAIRYHGLAAGWRAMDTPHVNPREQACILCMKCGDVCPTGALKAIPAEMDAILAEVAMGHAVVDKELCLSYQGKTCGVCYRACPFPDIAMRIGRLEQPIVTDACVGCGLCERSCIQMPQAVRVFPRKQAT